VSGDVGEMDLLLQYHAWLSHTFDTAPELGTLALLFMPVEEFVAAFMDSWDSAWRSKHV